MAGSEPAATPSGRCWCGRRRRWRTASTDVDLKAGRTVADVARVAITAEDHALVDRLVAAGQLSRFAADSLLAEAELMGVPIGDLLGGAGAPTGAPPIAVATSGEVPGAQAVRAVRAAVAAQAATAGVTGAVPGGHGTPGALAAPVLPSGHGGPLAHASGLDGGAHRMLTVARQRGASDLHLALGSAPRVRVHGSLELLPGYPVLTHTMIEGLLAELLGVAVVGQLRSHPELDTSVDLPGAEGRLRVNAFRQKGSLGAAIRFVPSSVPDFSSLGLPPVVRSFAELPRGLVLVTGPTGSGKSTTLASLIDAINRSKPVHVMSCEDPIEFVHPHRLALVNQREVGNDTASFPEALRRVLRQDPDVILVGEMRDLETIHMALTAAETGHLVFATLHTQSSAQTIERIVDVFPGDQQNHIRLMLASTLQAVVCQQLVPNADLRGRSVATEILVVTGAVRALIREGKVHQIHSQIQTGGSRHGMMTMDASLAALVRSGRVLLDTALERAVNPDELRQLAQGR